MRRGGSWNGLSKFRKEEVDDDGRKLFFLGSAAAGSCLGHDAIHRTEHSLERVARGLGRGWRSKSTRGGRVRNRATMSLCCLVSVLWHARIQGSSISGTETPDSRMTIAVDGFALDCWTRPRIVLLD